MEFHLRRYCSNCALWTFGASHEGVIVGTCGRAVDTPQPISPSAPKTTRGSDRCSHHTPRPDERIKQS